VCRKAGRRKRKNPNMVTIPPYHPLIIDYTPQVGSAQQQEKRDEERKAKVQNSKYSEKIRFEKRKTQEEKQKNRRRYPHDEGLLPENRGTDTSKKRLLDVIV
jgi:hypothetical protein